MILPSFILKSKKNLVLTESGLDSLSHCHDKEKFKKYPYLVEYHYNDRGFRDSNWPCSNDELVDSIWCFGDSFTVGMGARIDHIWPNILQEKINRRCINISMDGASNNWISRKAVELIETVQPKVIIIMWSFSSRRETNLLEDDENRRLHLTVSDTDGNYVDDVINFKNSINIVEAAAAKTSTKIIHSAITPEFFTIFGVQEYYKNIKGVDWPSTYTGIKNLNQLATIELKNSNLYEMFQTYDKLENEITEMTKKFVKVTQVDFSRDSYHYGINTALQIGNDFSNLI